MDPRARVTENKFDTEAWAQLVREAQSRVLANGIQELRDVFEEILKVFPTSVRLDHLAWQLTPHTPTCFSFHRRHRGQV